MTEVKKKGRKPSPDVTEVREFIRAGSLKEVLQQDGRLSQAGVDKLIKAVSFVVKP